MASPSSLSRLNAEQRRLKQQRNRKADWRQWGPFLAERAWGTVREDYSEEGDAWRYFTHEHARSRAYRWNEDGLMGFCDRDQHLCFSLGLWNGQDAFLKERLFGLAAHEGNHGEDVKELYWYQDATPTHSLARMRYRYPHAAFPYDELRQVNAERGYKDSEYELSDTGVLDGRGYFDVEITYAKADVDDILIVVEVINRADVPARISLVPQLWYRNTWSWGYPNGPRGVAPGIPSITRAGPHSVRASHATSSNYTFSWQGHPDCLFTNNDTNRELLYSDTSRTPFTKDAFHRRIVNGDTGATNPAEEGTKAGLHYSTRLKAQESRTFQFRLSASAKSRPFAGFGPLVKRRHKEADDFYNAIQPASLGEEQRLIQRQALAGMLWSQQIYYYDVGQWASGDPVNAVTKRSTRNSHWGHVESMDVLSMPDKWEYPWFAVWDTAFHCLPLAMTDTEFAKRQLVVMTREWFMHPNGQLPAYEWAFEDVNPPVHAWSTLEVYQMDKAATGKGDRRFLESLFHKLMLNFNWWVNRKDSNGDNVFEGGFLGLDNISLFDRSAEPPGGGTLKQSDGTAWMGFFSISMLHIALELAVDNPAYEDIATKFFEHFLRIASAINGDAEHAGLWDEEDGFFYDQMSSPDGTNTPIKVRSLVGLMPMIAVGQLTESTLNKCNDFTRRMHWLVKKHPKLAANMADVEAIGKSDRHLLSFVDQPRLKRMLKYLLDENEFLSPHGIRSLSRIHAIEPYTWTTHTGDTLSISYEPGEGETDLFGGNSNWRGPIWFPINYLLIEALRRYHAYYGDGFVVECPVGSGVNMHLGEVADELSRRLISLFDVNDGGKRPWCGEDAHLASSSKEGLHLFYEFFNGDTGEGVGASHQTGWTGLVALLMQQIND